MMVEQKASDFGDRLAGPGRHVYIAGGLALTEPGPAAIGVVVTDERGQVLARRAQYLGNAARSEATAQALLTAMRLAAGSGMVAPVFRLEDAELAEALADNRTLPDGAASLTPALREAADRLPGHRLRLVPASANLARPVALEPLVDWLPERTRRAEDLQVARVGGDEYLVQSEGQPGVLYEVTLRLPSAEDPRQSIRCECSDFQYRGIPCKHLLAVARAAGVTERLFYPGQ